MSSHFHSSDILYSSLVIGCEKSIKGLTSRQLTPFSKIQKRQKLRVRTRRKSISEEIVSGFRCAELVSSVVLYKNVLEGSRGSTSFSLSIERR